MRVSLVFSTLIAGSLAAEDINVRDLRLEIGGSNGPSQVDDTFTRGSTSVYASGTYHTSMKVETTGTLRLSFVDADLRRYGGFMWALGLSGSEGKLTIKNAPSNSVFDNLNYATYGPFGFIGYGHSMGPRAHWEIGPFLGLGFSSVKWYDSTGSTFFSSTGGGSFTEAGIKGGLFYRVGGRFVLGVTGGYLHSDVSAKIDYSETGSHSDLSFTSDTGMISASAAFRL